LFMVGRDDEDSFGQGRRATRSHGTSLGLASSWKRPSKRVVPGSENFNHRGKEGQEPKPGRRWDSDIFLADWARRRGQRGIRAFADAENGVTQPTTEAAWRLWREESCARPWVREPGRVVIEGRDSDERERPLFAKFFDSGLERFRGNGRSGDRAHRLSCGQSRPRRPGSRWGGSPRPWDTGAIENGGGQEAGRGALELGEQGAGRRISRFRLGGS